MDAKELRIGNLVDTPNPNMNPFRVESIENERIGGYNSFGSFVYWNINDIKPIPLSEQWLRDFRFSSTFSSDPQNWPASKCFNLYGFKVHQPIEDVDRFIFEPIVDDYIELEIIHHLQNFYFAITGKELEKIIP